MVNFGEQGGEQHFITVQATPIYQGTEPGSLVAEGGAAQLLPGDIFAGRPANNDTVWITTGIGFVPAAAVKGPCFAYQATTDIWIHEDHRSDARIAENGTARLHADQKFNAAQDVTGWLWIITGIGFIPDANVRVVGSMPVTYPHGQRTYVVQDGDTLSSIAGEFLGSPDRWEEIYRANPQIGANPNMLQVGQVLVIPLG